MRKAILTIASALTCLASQAQSVETIRKDYADAQQHVSLMNDPEYPPTNRYQVVREKMLCGSGQHKETVSLYFYEDENNDGNVCEKRSIRLATSTYNFAAREYYEEYLYDKAGNVEFIYAKDIDSEDWSEVEYRFYFDKKGVIKTTVQRKKNGDDNFTQEYSGSKVPDKYSKAFATYKHNAAAFKEQFKAIDSTARF